MDDERERETNNRTGGPHNTATGTGGVSQSDDTGVSPQSAAEEINPGGAGSAAPDPVTPDGD